MSNPNGPDELNLMEAVDGTDPPQTIHQRLQPISRLAAIAHSSEGCGIITLVREVHKRSASNPVDRVAGINYLMWPAGSQFDVPIYDTEVDVEIA